MKSVPTYLTSTGSSVCEVPPKMTSLISVTLKPWLLKLVLNCNDELKKTNYFVARIMKRLNITNDEYWRKNYLPWWKECKVPEGSRCKRSIPKPWPWKRQFSIGRWWRRWSTDFRQSFGVLKTTEKVRIISQWQFFQTMDHEYYQLNKKNKIP